MRMRATSSRWWWSLTLAALAVASVVGACDDDSRWCCPPDVGECSCPSGEDSCGGGANMTNPRAPGPATADGDGTGVRIAWDPGTGPGQTLPASYFDVISIVPPADGGAAPALRATHVAEREILVLLQGSPGDLEGKTVPFTLEFPDRRRAIVCRHPGMEDRYLLDVALTFGGAGAIATSSLTERYVPGNI